MPAHVPAIDKLARFARKPLPDKWRTLRATFSRDKDAVVVRRLHRVLTGAQAPPQVLHSDRKTYIAYRPDSDAHFHEHPEISEIAAKWISENLLNNAGDLPRLYSLAFNTKQVLLDRVAGGVAELGVYRGNSAALLAYYARLHNRPIFLFDTFEGFDQRDLVGIDGSKSDEFSDVSLARVRDLVGEKDVRFIKGRFPASIPPDVYDQRFCLVHIDCDLYEPAKAGLEFFYPRLSTGGLLIVHDYANAYWPGIRRAVAEYCRTIPEWPIILPDKSGTAMIRKSDR